jgi:hypothetical protein
METSDLTASHSKRMLLITFLKIGGRIEVQADARTDVRAVTPEP